MSDQKLAEFLTQRNVEIETLKHQCDASKRNNEQSNNEKRQLMESNQELHTQLEGTKLKCEQTELYLAEKV